MVKFNALIAMGILIAVMSACRVLGICSSESWYCKADPPPPREKGFEDEIKFPFDYPAVKINGQKGDYVLCPKLEQLIELTKTNDPTKHILDWEIGIIKKSGGEKTEVEYSFNNFRQEIPNAFLIPLPAGAKPETGDILLTWRYQKGISRAIVWDDGSRSGKAMRYLDYAGNSTAPEFSYPADERLKVNQITVLKNELEPGTSAAIRKGADFERVIVINQTENKVFVRSFAGYVNVFPKSEVIGIPVKPNIKKGDHVKIGQFDKFIPAIVTDVNQRFGRVEVKYDEGGATESIAFGDILPD